MSNEVGKKMSEYTALASGEKDYFFGDGEGSVVTVGKVAQGGSDVNRLVKISDIAGDALPAIGASHADAGKVLTVKNNDGTDEIVWDAVPTEIPSTSGHSTGDVLTYTQNGIDWAAPSGGGGGGVLTPVSVEVVHTSGKCTINVPSNNSFVTVTGLDKYKSDAGYGIYITPPTVASGELLNCVVEIIGGDGSDHWINVNGEYGQYLMLASPTSNKLMGFSAAHVTFLGKCYTIVTDGGGS